MRKVLLTGSNGFTGKYVANELKSQGYHVIGLVHSEARSGEVVCDITDENQVYNCLKHVKPDYIIHLAALSFVAHSDQNEFYDVNVFGALNLLDAAKKLKLPLKKVILASSANVYGNPQSKCKIQETAPLSPVNHYAMSKLAMEYMAKTRFDFFPIVITRPFNYTGPAQSENFLIPKIVSHFKSKSKVIELGNTNVSRDFTDVRDIAKAYMHLLKSEVRSDVINLCSGNVYSLADVVSKMESIAGYEIHLKVNPDFIRTNEIKELCGDNTKLKALTDFSPTIGFDKTLLDMYLAT